MAKEEDIRPEDVELARMIRFDILSGIDPEGTFQTGRSLYAPALWVGYAALAMTNELTPQAALLRLFNDPALQEEVIGVFDHPALAAAPETRRPNFPAVERIRALQEMGSSGLISLTDLNPGELIRLVFEKQRRLSILHISRNQKGTEDNFLTVTILNSEGAALGTFGDRLKTGNSVYFGVKRGDFWLNPVLARGSMPAWADSIKSGKKRWVYSAVKQANGFTLQQAYYGSSDNHPLFHE